MHVCFVHMILLCTNQMQIIFKRTIITWTWYASRSNFAFIIFFILILTSCNIFKLESQTYTLYFIIQVFRTKPLFFKLTWPKDNYLIFMAKRQILYWFYSISNIDLSERGHDSTPCIYTCKMVKRILNCKAKKEKNMWVYCHMLKKLLSVGTCRHFYFYFFFIPIKEFMYLYRIDPRAHLYHPWVRITVLLFVRITWLWYLILKFLKVQ